MAGKKIAILVDFNYEDLELWYPLLRFREEGMVPVTVGAEKGKDYKSKHGYSCVSDQSIADVKIEDFDAVLVPGGWCPDYLRRDKRMVDLVKKGVETGKVVATICHGGWMLCSAKCIQGRKVTGFCAIKDDLENAGAIFEDAAVVVDGNIVTSRIPTDLPEFCKAIIAKLK